MGILDRLKKHRGQITESARPPLTAVTKIQQSPSESPVSSQVDTKVSIGHFVNSLEVPTLTANYARHLRARCEDTASWPQRASEFKQWLGQDSPISYLWCAGKPGAGKSVIAAVLLEYLENDYSQKSEDDHIGLAYAFFDYKKASRSDHEELVKSILFQLCIGLKGDYPDCITQLSKKEHPTFDDFQAALQLLVGSFDDIRIVIDALDECDKSCQGASLEMFRSLFSVAKGQKIRLLLSSRKNAEIENFYVSAQSLASCFKIEIRATDEDIERYVNSVIEEDEKQKKQDGKPTPLIDNQQLRKEMIAKLVEHSNGMFLWARLQVKHLKDLEKPEKIRRFTQELPIDEEIEATYVQMLKRIEALPENEKRIAQRCLLWVTYAVQPLTQRELEEAIRIEDATSSSAERETAMILRVCSNFLELEASTEHVVFVHFSAVEFLKSQPDAGARGIEHYFHELSAAHLTLAKLCSKYLLHSFTEDEATSALSDTGWFLVGHGLAFYACHYFDYHLFEHYSQEGDSIDHDAKECMEEFLGCENAVLVGFMLIRTLDDMWSMNLFDKVDFWPGQVSRETIIRSTRLNAIPEFRLPDRTALEEMEANGWILHHAAFTDDIDLVENILDNASPEFVRRTDSRGATALYYAARQGNDVVCQRLIDVGQIDPNDGNEFSNPLQAAAFGGHRKVVLLLLGRGANAGLIGGLHNSPLQAAAWGEHYALVYDLLRSGKVNINASSKGSASTYCALQAAAFRGNDSIVHLLLDAGAEVDIPEPGGEGTQFGLPLQAAMHGGHISTAKILLDASADINAESGEGGVAGTAATALQAAAWGGHREAVKFLIERNADVKQIAGTHGSALHAALTRGREEVVDILLEKGANIQETVGKYGSSLQAAATSGNERLVRLVLDAGVKPNVKGGYFKSPLIAAAQRGSLSIVTMLVEAGADLEAFDGNYGTALDAAAYARHPEIVRYLLEKGATVGGALVEIASSDQVDLAEELIRRGADVNAPGRSPYEVPLQAASWGANPKMVELLLTKGAHVNHRGGAYGNALHAAVYSGSLEVVKLLIQAGADPNNPSGQGPDGTPLQCACIQVHENVVRYLLENGAKANVQPCGEFGTALQAAVVKNYEPVVKLLLDYGADVNVVGGKHGTALEAAAFNGNIELATLLIGCGANVNEQAGTYGSALQAAAFRAKPDMVKLLLDAKANPDARGGTFGRPLQAAAYSGNEAVVRLLLDHHAKVNAVSTSKCGTALQAAVQQGNEGIVKILLENGAELLDGRKDQGPLTLAQKNGQQKIALMLLDHAQKASDGWEDIDG